MKLTPLEQRRAIMALLTTNEGRVLLADEIAPYFRLSRAVTYRRLADLVRAGLVERIWNWDMPMPRFGVSDDANARLMVMLAEIIKRAGPAGLTKGEANDQLIEAVLEGGLAVRS